MAGTGLDLATWLAIPGVFLLFFGLPLSMLEYDRRKALRENKHVRPDASSQHVESADRHGRRAQPPR